VISEQFGFYHVGIFLLDDEHQYAVLRASNSEGGRRMLARRHSLRVGHSGIVGHVAATGSPRIALDVELDTAFKDNPDLPDTRSEMALPLKAVDHIIGVLDVQSTELDAFQSEDTEILYTLANQVAIAIQNARSHEATHKLLDEAQKASANKTVFQGEMLIENGTTATLAIPIRLRGEVVGVLDIHVPAEHDWDPDEVDIAKAVADRLSLALESATLLQATQRRAEIERIIAEISGKVSSSINLRNVLQTAVEEIGHALPGAEVVIQFQTDQSKSRVGP
jgi:GAF domain-containing protein